MKKMIKAIVTFTLSAGLLTVSSAATAQASSKHYTTIPTSLRGTWFQLHRTEKLKFTKYTYTGYTGNHPSTLSGKKFVKGSKPAMTELWVSNKNNHGYYAIGSNGTDAVSYFKRTTIKLHGKKYAALKNMNWAGSGPFYLKGTYFVHYKNLK